MEGFFGWMLESSLLVIMILCIRRIFMGRIRYAVIYSLWLIVLLRFIIPVNFIPAPINIGDVFSDAILSGISYDREINLSDDAEILTKDNMSDGAITNEHGMSSSAILSGDNNNVTGDISVNSYRGTAGKYIVFGSVTVSVVLLLWIILSNVCMLAGIKRCRIFYGRRNGVNIYTVCNIDNPCLYGFLRPAIYIPESLVFDVGNADEGMRIRVEDDELEQIITHEYVHFIHKDHIWSVVRIILICLYWFNPFLWAAAICSKKDAELFCDEAVLRRIGDEKCISYGEMLVRLAKDARWGDFRYAVMPMSRRGKEMERRIRAISSRRRYSMWMTAPLILLVALSLVVTCGTGALKVKGKGGESAGIINMPCIFINNEGISTDSVHDGDSEILQEDIDGWPAGEEYEDKAEIVTIKADTGIISDDYEQAFSNYINVFTEAVNTGNTDNLHNVLWSESNVYEQQCNIAKNYYSRGIREEVKSYAIVSVSIVEESNQESSRVDIISKEKIKVYYADNTSKIVKQKYKYTCQKIDGRWIITEMSDIDSASIVSLQ